MEVIIMIFMGLTNGIWFGNNRARAMENLPPSTTPPPRWAYLAFLVALVAIFVWTLMRTPTDSQFEVLLRIGLLGLGVAFGYAVGAALGFLITRHLAKKRSSA
jgi:hypothetical protein